MLIDCFGDGVGDAVRSRRRGLAQSHTTSVSTGVYVYEVQYHSSANEFEYLLICFVRSLLMPRSWLARCFIRNGKPHDAWELYLKMDNHDSFNFLSLVANECYQAGAYFYAAKVRSRSVF